jgi:hypothetical protein
MTCDSSGSLASRPFSLTAIRQLLRRPAPQRAGKRAVTSSDNPMALPTSRTALRPAIGDDGCREPRPLAAIAVIKILDDLLAPLMLEIDVDVGRLPALLRQEALEQEIDFGGIDGGDAEAVADGGIGGRAAAPGTGSASPATGRSGRCRGR